MDDFSQQPLIRRFTVRRLYGYKDVELNFSSSVKIVIAENGTGKTTVLNMLYAFLARRFSRLAKYDFHSIECEIGSGEQLSLTKEGIAISPPGGMTSDIREIIEDAGLQVDEVVDFAVNEFDNLPMNELRSHPIYDRIYRSSPLDTDQTRSFFAEIAERSNSAIPADLDSLIEKIKRRLGPTQILYLPTYRRIELASPRNSPESASVRLRTMRTNVSGRSSSSVGPQMFFGLADVEKKLKELTEEIGRRSNQGYRTTSATILDDLLTGRKLSSPEYSLPEIETLRLFFSRVVEPDEAKARLERLEKMYKSGQIADQHNDLLRYFLQKLASVANETKHIERMLEQFAEIVNIYLTASSDGKELRYDPQLTKVSVKNLWTEKEIKLEDLSSGEKQVISLFAHLYLDPQPKFVLIDEPELSLSIDWQRQLLPHIAKAPSCNQLLAITHSPFIFENDLDPYAENLRITRFPEA